MSTRVQSEKSILEKIFHEDVSVDFQLDVMRALGSAFDEAGMHCCPPKFGPNESLDLRGHYIRAHFETRLRRLGTIYPNTQVESRPNSRKNYHHTWVKIGRVILTASSVCDKKEKPRPSEFRNDYASNGQLSLFKEILSVKEGDIYAILRYGPLRAKAPSILSVSFPNDDWSRFVENIDLLALHPGIIQVPKVDAVEIQEETVPEINFTPEESIQQPNIPPLRHKKRKAAGEEKL